MMGMLGVLGCLRTIACARRTEIFDALVIGCHDLVFHFEAALIVRGNADSRVVRLYGDAHDGIAKAIKDIDFCCWIAETFRDALEHWIGERRKDIVDLGQKKRKESSIAVTDDG